MSINYKENTKTFYLNTEHTTYACCVNETQTLEHLYYGVSISDDDLRHVCFRQPYSFAPYEKETGDTVSPDTFFQELPTANGGDFRICALNLIDSQGKYGTRLKYVSHEIRPGRQPLPGLPCSDGEAAESLEIVLHSEGEDIEVRLCYVVYGKEDVIARYMKVTNCGGHKIHIRKAASALDIQGRDYELIELYGTYHHERAMVQRTMLKYGIQGSFSHKGASGHEVNPFFAICSANATEDWGEVYGFNLMYSGNFENEVQVDKLGNTRVVTGISDYEFDWELAAGESFLTPESLITYTNQGIGAMSRNFHDFIRRHIIHPNFAFSHRPVVLNTWEAFCFDVDEEKLLDVADSAKEVGAELLVLDDGWFRDNDREGLGDWKVSEKKFPSGLKKLSRRLHEKGLKFGLWFEPEMVSESSELYWKHPEWALGTCDEQYLGRGQLVLDMGNTDVVDHIFSRICACLDSVKVEYIKWDMNRYISEIGSFHTANQGEVFHRHMLGVYELLRRVTERYPDTLLETCAGGGGRFDLGMLYYSPQIWTSDNTDPFVRTDIQLGTSIAYPNSTISCHYTAAKVTGLCAGTRFRYASAAFGPYGYELDPRTLAPEKRQQLLGLTMAQKEGEDLMLSGDLYRLINHKDGNFAAYMQVAKDKSRAELTFIQYFYTAMEQSKVVRLKGLDPAGMYECSLLDRPCRGDILMHVGIRIPDIMNKSGKAVRVLLKRTEN